MIKNSQTFLLDKLSPASIETGELKCQAFFEKKMAEILFQPKIFYTVTYLLFRFFQSNNIFQGVFRHKLTTTAAAKKIPSYCFIVIAYIQIRNFFIFICSAANGATNIIHSFNLAWGRFYPPHAFLS